MNGVGRLVGLGVAFALTALGVLLYIAFVGIPDLAVLDTRTICTLTDHPEVKVTGSDLGYPVEHNGRLYLLFGDTRDVEPSLTREQITERPHPEGTDSVARAPLNFDPDTCIPLQFISSDSSFVAVTLDGAEKGNFETPVSAFSHGGQLWGFFSLRDQRPGGCPVSDEPIPEGCALHDAVPGGRSVVARSTNGHAFTAVKETSKGKFQWPVGYVVSRGDVAGVPDEINTEDILLVWGTGFEKAGAKFRQSYPYLAVASLPPNENWAWRYFEGVDTSFNLRWGSSEAAAASVFARLSAFRPIDAEPDPQHCLGEFSVTRTPYGQWMMLYTCNGPPVNGQHGRGIFLRTAKAPWGPWSQPLLIFNPETDGYCKVMHRRLPSDCAGIGPNPGDLGQRDSNDPNLLADGGEYAPELLPARYFKVDGEVMTIYYVMSTWNPYHAILVRTRVTTSRFARLVAFLGSLRTLMFVSG